jgi:hypothetical protein
VREDRDDIQMLQLDEDDVHIVSVLNHRVLNAAVYASIAVLKPAETTTATLSKSHMAIRATEIGITSFDFGVPEDTRSVREAYMHACNTCIHVIHACI